MTDTLRHWPLIEVIAEFHTPDGVWREEFADALYDKLRHSLPVRKCLDRVTAQFELGAMPREQYSKRFKRHQFFADDGTKLVQVDEQVLTVNHLRPYTCWEDYSTLIGEAVEAHRSVSGIADFVRVSLHYINRIELHGLPIAIEDYLEFYPRFNGEFLNCGCMVTQPWPEQQSVIYRQMQTQPLESDCLPITLILNAQRSGEGLPDYLGWLNSAHAKLNEVFKSSITAKTRKLFNTAEER